MKKLIFTLAIILTFFSCKNDDDNNGPVELIGTWLLVEQYSDPGDGSGDYVSVDSDKTITFISNATITSNGNLCSMDTNSNEDSIGAFNTSNNTILPDGCFSSEYTLTYEIKENRLFVYYPCIEGCGQKFRKVN